MQFGELHKQISDRCSVPVQESDGALDTSPCQFSFSQGSLLIVVVVVVVRFFNNNYDKCIVN